MAVVGLEEAREYECLRRDKKADWKDDGSKVFASRATEGADWSLM